MSAIPPIVDILGVVAKSSLMTQSEHSEGSRGMSAFGGKADINQGLAEGPLIAINGHRSTGR